MRVCDLLLVPRQEVLALAERLSAGREVEHLVVPTAGSWLLQMREGVRGDRWYIGEIPAAQAAVRLYDRQLGSCRGAAVIMRADAELAVAAAILDAVARASWPGCDEIAALAARGSAERLRAEGQRAAIRAATRVSFSELGTEQDA
ncbi:MAG: phosphonate C-P lyase system protein PhnG [Planctomycetota bacterium]|nr:phosphonate C-P lyase system protein PhnG [Planctomycetota bacterium]MCX8039511.1 phosphonate C-P lyase system protein PhnG [Planctomycetota bacterium]MDW8373031.1 phosphonate C-P lyase system protein PhnG [Planctomycetota bacterium]